MKVRFNNLVTSFEGVSLYDFMSEQNLLEKKGIAVAINQEVISKTDWKEQKLEESDQIIVITAAAGG